MFYLFFLHFQYFIEHPKLFKKGDWVTSLFTFHFLVPCPPHPCVCVYACAHACVCVCMWNRSEHGCLGFSGSNLFVEKLPSAKLVAFDDSLEDCSHHSPHLELCHQLDNTEFTVCYFQPTKWAASQNSGHFL